MSVSCDFATYGNQRALIFYIANHRDSPPATPPLLAKSQVERLHLKKTRRQDRNCPRSSIAAKDRKIARVCGLWCVRHLGGKTSLRFIQAVLEGVPPMGLQLLR